MELLKVILNFIAKVANPLVVLLVIALFRPQLGNILEMLMRILKKVETGEKNLRAGSFEVTNNLPEAAALKVKELDLDSATKIVQELLSPAVPLALGYVENFITKIKKGENGFHFRLKSKSNSPWIVGIYFIYIPHELTNEEASSTDLIQSKYRNANIEAIVIEKNNSSGKDLNGSAIRDKDVLYPVDVPQTLTSIRHVFRFREEQLKVKGHMGTVQIRKLEADNLDQFAHVLEEKIKELEMSKCIRVIRDSAHLFVKKSD